MQDADNDAASGGNSNTSSVNNNESMTEPRAAEPDRQRHQRL
jgi:hypothetical protein